MTKQEKELKQDLINISYGGTITPVLFKIKSLLAEQRKEIIEEIEEWDELLTETGYLEGENDRILRDWVQGERKGRNEKVKEIRDKLKNL